MILECCAIIILVSVMSYFMLRSGKSGYAVGTLPLLLVPAFHIASSAIASFFLPYFDVALLTLRIGVDVFAVIVSCILIGSISLGIKNSGKRTAFLCMCGGFSLILTTVLIESML